ncbi:MAG: hypothetical protein M1824_004305 [Vezdaea acicularis]|nr:MAG: hypothetical protein M1824_004305 [Vezdaea acicularis]
MSLPSETYFVPGFGISRQVLQNTICYYLGPAAFVRPYVHQRQLDDICEASKEWERQESARMIQDAVEDEEMYINRPIQIRSRDPREGRSSRRGR